MDINKVNGAKCFGKPCSQELILTERDMAMTNEKLITNTFNFSKLVAKNMCFHLTMLIN